MPSPPLGSAVTQLTDEISLLGLSHLQQWDSITSLCNSLIFLAPSEAQN